jgi:hypothetical protein
MNNSSNAIRGKTRKRISKRQGIQPLRQPDRNYQIPVCAPPGFDIVSSHFPGPAAPSTLMPLPFRSTSAGLPVVLVTALLPCSTLPPAAKETRSDCLFLDGCAPRSRYCCNARRNDDSLNRISLDRHSSLTDFTQRSAYEFRFRLLPGN